jgi:hypothetical protein
MAALSEENSYVCEHAISEKRGSGRDTNYNGNIVGNRFLGFIDKVIKKGNSASSANLDSM